MIVLRRLLNAVRVRGLTNSKDIIDAQNKSYILASHCVRLFYAFGFYFLALYINECIAWLKLIEIHPLWPVVWVNLIGIRNGVIIILFLFTSATIVATAFPNKRICRILYFIGLLQLIAFSYSIEGFGHSLHAWIAVAFMLIFLPDRTSSHTITSRHKYLTAFLGSQILVTLFYSLSGFWKLYYGVVQLLKGEVNSFSPYALPYHIANRLHQTNSSSILGDFFMSHPYISWPFYLCILYIEVFSIVAVFRPTVHRIWGFLLIFLHLGSYLTLTIIFKQTILLLGFLFICSPFIQFEKGIKESIVDLPLISDITTQAVKIIKRFKLLNEQI